MVTGMPDPMAEARNITAAMTMLFLRPILLVMGPAANAPIAAPMRARATDWPTHRFLEASVSSSPPANPESASMNMPLSTGTAPLITAVSKPKRNPPRAATLTMPSVKPRLPPSDDGACSVTRCSGAVRTRGYGGGPEECAAGRTPRGTASIRNRPAPVCVPVDRTHEKTRPAGGFWESQRPSRSAGRIDQSMVCTRSLRFSSIRLMLVLFCFARR